MGLQVQRLVLELREPTRRRMYIDSRLPTHQFGDTGVEVEGVSNKLCFSSNNEKSIS
jgi:hypothetical protein